MQHAKVCEEKQCDRLCCWTETRNDGRDLQTVVSHAQTMHAIVRVWRMGTLTTDERVCDDMTTGRVRSLKSADLCFGLRKGG